LSEASGRRATATESTSIDASIDVSNRSVAAFVGRALRGPLNTPVPVRSFAQYSQRFGGAWAHSGLGSAVRQFFEHGGSKVYVVRVANNARGAELRLPTAEGALVLRAREPGSTEYVRVSVDYDRLPVSDLEHFNLTVQRITPTTSLILDQEIYNRLSCAATSRNYVADALLDSALVQVESVASSARPYATMGPHIGSGEQYIGHTVCGTDGDELSDYDVVGSATEATGIFALNGVDRLDLLYLPAGGRDREFGPAASMAAELYCRKRGAMLIVDPPMAWQSAEEAVSGARSSGLASANVVTYFPRLTNRHEPQAKPSAVGGAIAGLLCKLDEQQGPWMDLDQVAFGFRPGLSPALALEDVEGQALVRQGVNVIAGVAGGRLTLCGAVTAARKTQREQQLVCLPSRRLCLHISSGLSQATRWAVFAADTQSAERRLQAQVEAFMQRLANAGAFDKGSFRMQCKIHLPADPRDSARALSVLIAFLPVGASDAIRVTLQQTVQGCSVRSTAFAPEILAFA